MGGSNSRNSVPINVQTIEHNLIGLNNKLDAGEKFVDNYIKQQLIKALDGYRTQVETKSRSMSFSRKTSNAQRFRIRDYITQATNKIEKLQIKNYDLKNTITKSTKEMESFMLYIQNVRRLHQIDQNECERIFKAIKLYVEKNRRQIKRDDEIALVILELYVKCPQQKQKNSQITHLDAFLENMRNARKNLDKFDLKNADFVKVRQKIEEIKIEIKSIDHKISKIEGNLNQSHNRPVNSKSSNKEELVRFSKRPAQDVKQQSKFPKKGTEPKNLSKSLDILKSIDAKILSVTSSKMEYLEKQRAFAECKQELIQIETYNNSEIVNTRIKLLNRTYGLSLLETANYLKNIKIKVDECKKYIPQADTECQENKRALQYLLINLAKIEAPNPYVRKQVQFIQSIIYETITTLDTKMREIENTSCAFKKINTIEEQIVRNVKLPLFQRLITFNNYRRELVTIENHSTEIRQKKKAIVRLMKKYEDQFLRNSPEFLRNFKMNLNRCELAVHDLPFPVEPITYQQKTNELNNLWKNYVVLFETQFGVERTAIFEDTVKSIIDFLQKVYSDDNKDEERLQSIEQSVTKILTSSSVTDRCKLLEPYEEQIQQMKRYAIKSEIRNRIERVQANIFLERSKIELRNLCKDLKEGKQTRPTTTNTDIFQNKLNQLFSFKVRFDNLPDNSELNDQKQKFLDEFCNILRDIDEYLLEAVYDKQVNLLDLNDQFSFRPEQITAPKNSVEFVQIIHQNAKSFEDRVKNYVGTNYSVDYYVINENLMRFLEELDQVNCRNNQNLLSEVLKTMDYIKKLLDQLAAKATSEESVQLVETVSEKSEVNILDLHDQFNFKPEAINVPRESLEFVQIIHHNAENFEERVKNYSGTNYSVDYYVIYENLMQFLEELDKINCRNNNDLLVEVLKTINYVKKLLDQLSSVATCD